MCPVTVIVSLCVLFALSQVCSFGSHLTLTDCKIVLMKNIYINLPLPFVMCILCDAPITPILESGCQLWEFQAGNN